MSSRQTKFPKKKVPARSVHQTTQIMGRNGLPVDAHATLEPGQILVGATTNPVTYSKPTVTVDNSNDLSSIINFQDVEYTGVLLFSGADSKTQYFIDPDSIDNTTKTFNIYTDEDFTKSPNSINQEAGWFISEAVLINRLQTTSTAVIDNVEFRDVAVTLDGSLDANVQIDAQDGDSVLSVGTEDGTFEGTQHVTRVDEGGRVFVRRYGHDILFQLLNNSKFLELANFDKVVPVFTDDTAVLQYFEDGNLIREAILVYTNEETWSVELKSYVLLENGQKLELEDSTELSLE